MDINKQNDKEVEKLEKKLRAVYLQAQSETQTKLEDYLQRFATKDAIKQEQVKQGKITQEEYINWRKGQIAVGKLWQDKVNTLAADYANANCIAVGMLRNSMAGVFAENHNYAAYQLEHDTMLDLSFSLYDQNTVRNLVMNNPDVLPLPFVDTPKDQRWNRQKINSVITQAVLQGDSIPKIAQNLRKVADMNYKAAVRNARTSMTAAQSAGRVESYKHAQDMGINLEQEWLATLDGRTRHSHRQMDGERIAVAKDKWHPAKFSNGCRYPGDPQGPPWEIYNCRCTLVAVIKGIDQSSAPRNSKLGDMSYEEWKNGHKAQPAQAVAPPVRSSYMTLYNGADKYFKENGFNDWLNSLSFGEKSSIKAYAGGGSIYLNMNRYLRGEISLEEYAKKSLYSVEIAEKRVRNIKSALDKFELNDDIQVLRVSDAVIYKSLNVGDTFKDNAFVSTTTDKSRIDPNATVQMVIDVPKGKGRGAWVTPLAQNKDENEFLLNSGQEYEVYGKEIKDGIVYLKLRIKIEQ